MGKPIERKTTKQRLNWRRPSDSLPVRSAPALDNTASLNGAKRPPTVGDVITISRAGREVQVTVIRARPGPIYTVCSPLINNNETFEYRPKGE